MSGKVGAICRPHCGKLHLPHLPITRYRLSAIDEWNKRCNLPPAGGKLHLPHLPISDIGLRLSMNNYGSNAGWKTKCLEDRVAIYFCLLCEALPLTPTNHWGSIFNIFSANSLLVSICVCGVYELHWKLHVFPQQICAKHFTKTR